jgi:hemerythrin
MPISWNPKLDTGIDVIDAQHRRIVDYVNQLEEARLKGDRHQIGDVIEQLVDYTQSHFSFEETMMEQAGYKFLKPHQKVHELFIRRVSTFTVRAAKGEDIAEELQGTLTTWLLNHIASEDHDYAEVVRKMTGESGSSGDSAAAPAAAAGATAPPGFIAGLLRRFFRS